MPDVHLRLHGLEIVRLIGLDLSSHSLAGPLPETVKLAVHYDRSGVSWRVVNGMQ